MFAFFVESRAWGEKSTGLKRVAQAAKKMALQPPRHQQGMGSVEARGVPRTTRCKDLPFAILLGLALVSRTMGVDPVSGVSVTDWRHAIASRKSSSNSK